MSKRNLARGTLMLAGAGILAKLLGFFFRVPLIYMIGEEGIGIYQLTYPLFTFIIGLSAGVPVAMSKMISERVVIGKKSEAYEVFKISAVLMGTLGGVSSLLIIIFGRDIVHIFRWNEGVYYSLMGIALSPLFTCLLTACKGLYQGYQNMIPTALSQITEQLVRVAAGVGFAWIMLPRGLYKAAGAASFGATAGAAAGLFLMLIIFRNTDIKPALPVKDKKRRVLCIELIKTALPISIGQAIGSIIAVIDSFLVPVLLIKSGFSEGVATALYGQLTGKAFVLVNIPLTISAALAQSAVPRVAEYHASGSNKKLSYSINSVLRYSMLSGLPCAAGLMCLSKGILSVVFQDNGSGYELLAILAAASIFIIITQSSAGILNGLGKTYMPALIMFGGSLIKLIVNFCFIPVLSLNIRAAAYGTLAAYIFTATISIIMVKKTSRAEINIKETFTLPGLCSLIMLLPVVLTYRYMYNLTDSVNAAVLTAIPLGAVVYMSVLLLTGALDIKEIKSILCRN